MRLLAAVNLVGVAVAAEVLDDAARLVGDKLIQAHQDALARQDYVTAVLTQFKLDLDHAELERILQRSPG